MNRNAKTIALSATLLVVAHALFGQAYVRPVTLPPGESTKLIQVDEYKDGTRIVVGKDNYTPPSGEAQGSSSFLLINGMLMETTERSSGNMKLGKIILPLDGVKFNGVLVSDSRNRIELTAENSKDYASLDASVKHETTVFKFKDTLDLSPSLRDSVLRIDRRIMVHCGKENDPDFQLIINGEKLLPVSLKAGMDHDLTEELGKLGLSDPDKIKAVTFVPKGHVPTVVTEIDQVKNEDRTSLPPVAPTIPWLWIGIGAGLALLGSIVALLMRSRRKREEAVSSQFMDRPERGQEKRKGGVEEADEVEMDPVERRIAAARADERRKWEAEVDRLKEGKNELENQVIGLQDSLKKEKEDVEKRLEEACEKERRKSEKEINRLNEDKSELEAKINGLKDDLKKEKEDAEKRVSSAREDERTKYEGKINDLVEEKQKLNETLSQEREQAKKDIAEAHKEEQDIAEKAISDLKASHLEAVKRLEDQQRVYSEKIAFVPYASQYARDIYSLIGTVNDINLQAKELTKVEVEDPYLIFKAISKFNLVQSEIDYEGLLLDVSLAAREDMSFANSGITNLKTVPQEQMFSSLRSYFLSAYLEKYINAAVVYNESLAGIDRLVDGIDESMTAPFKLYREKLKDCFKRLGIAVISVKLFDTLGDNVDLKATMVDFDSSLPADSIIAIENCLVYPEGGRRPMEKIYVKAQK